MAYRADSQTACVSPHQSRNRTLTSWPSVKTDIENAGGHWVDQPVKVCDGDENVIVSSRKPDDLPEFCAQFVATFADWARTRTHTAA